MNYCRGRYTGRAIQPHRTSGVDELDVDTRVFTGRYVVRAYLRERGTNVVVWACPHRHKGRLRTGGKNGVFYAQKCGERELRRRTREATAVNAREGRDRAVEAPSRCARTDLLAFQRWVVLGLYRIVSWGEYVRETKSPESVAAWRCTSPGGRER